MSLASPETVNQDGGQQRQCMQGTACGDEFLVNKGVKPMDIYRRLQAQYGDDTLSRSKTFEWCKRFKDGRTSISDDPGRGGCQPTAVIPMNIQRVERLILDNRCITCHEIAEEMNFLWER